MKNLFNISDLTKNELISILDLEFNNFINDKSIGLIFEKPSTRTRISFSVAIKQLKGNTIDIKFSEINISRKESFEDTFRAFNCYLDGLIYRTNSHKKLLEASKFFDKPIINALSDLSHPCQIISDLLTLKEHFGSLNNHILWMGDMNNVCFSLVEAVNLIDDLNLTICTHKSIMLKNEWKLNKNINLIDNLNKINLNSVTCVMTDVFLSMNDEENYEKITSLKPYVVNSDIMNKTAANSVFMHCLPAKVGFEVTDEVFRGSKSIVWRQAYNRMVAQKKLLQFIYQ